MEDSAIEFDEALGMGEAHASAAASGTIAEERLGSLSQGFIVHSAAGIGDFEFYKIISNIFLDGNFNVAFFVGVRFHRIAQDVGCG